MVLETDPTFFWQWLQDSFGSFLLLAFGCMVVALALGYLGATLIHGPLRGGDLTLQACIAGVQDLLGARPRRIWALARLAIQESIRRRVWVALVLFILILIFAGWFLDPTTPDPARLYLTFVLWATTYLVLLLALFLSVFSLPMDLKHKTIYTIVTKPVRRSEIFLGRVLGFSIVGGVLLTVMGLISYVFLVRSLTHSHEVETASLKPVANSKDGAVSGRVTTSEGHSHEVKIEADGEGATDVRNGHWHRITPGSGKSSYVVGPPEDVFVARVPRYGQLRFKDRWGKAGGKGISVGSEWTYRSFIEGGTLAAAIWKFDNVTPELYPDGLPIEMTIRVFRSWKGDINRGIVGSLTLRNPVTGRTSSAQNFTAKDVQIDHRLIPRELTDASGKPLDLFKDLVSPEDQSVEVVLQCLERQQYYGMAKADMYLKAQDASFTMNFIKGFLGIGFQMVLVIGFSVLFSTFLSAPVALLAELSAIVMGFCTGFIIDLADGVARGGGPLESMIRIPEQMNVTSPLEEGMTKTVVEYIDGGLLSMMKGTCYLLPDFNTFNNVNHLVYGFNIPFDNLGRQLVLTLAYLAAVLIAGTFILKTREVAQ